MQVRRRNKTTGTTERLSGVSHLIHSIRIRADPIDHDAMSGLTLEVVASACPKHECSSCRALSLTFVNIK